MSTRHRKTNGTQEGLSSKKSPETQQKEAQHTPFDVMLGFSSLQRFSAGKTMLCLQEALSHFAKWCKNALCRKIPHPKAYRIRSAVLCFLMCFFHAGRKDFTVLTISGFNKAFLLPHSDFTQQLSRNAAEHP
ncbi:MAG: hypothetical protein SPG86_08020 [Gemmiger sp.]|jgi:hypothetical protein|uniref:hypothetical protein n=1 Tax=Gemmiger sp. TaxID=2049027 RepID=UPI0022E8770B|nr:hypothetical protein [Gemmiger sp.]MDY5411509.1 hypothetical protein [Gemmiger sp.]